MFPFIEDDLGLESETDSERLARENMEADLALIAQLRHIREQRGLSQADLGALMGVTQASVSAFEGGDEAKLSTIRRYAHALRVVVTHELEFAEVVFARSSWTPRVSATSVQVAPVPTALTAANSRRADFALAG